jgi:pheromone shutdown protein TraB
LVQIIIDGVRVILLGTAHISRQSVDDVLQIMGTAEPQLVLVELCDA